MSTGTLSRHWIVGSLQLLRWIFFSPSSWRRFFQRRDPLLAPQFALADLDGRHWADPEIRRLLLYGLGGIPLLSCGGLSLLLWSLGELGPTTFWAMSIGAVVALCLGVVVSTAAGIVTAFLAILLFGLAWSGEQPLMVDMVLGVRFALLFGTMSGVAVYAVRQVMAAGAKVATRGQAFRQIGAFLIGLVVSVMMFSFSVGVAGTSISARQAGNIPDGLTGVAAAAAPTLLIGFATGWHTRSWRHGVRVGLLLLWLSVIMYGNLSSRFNQTLDGSELLFLICFTVVLIYLALFTLPFAAVERVAGPWAGVVAGALGSIAIYAVIKRFILFFPLWENVMVGSVLVLLGLTMVYWRPLVFYPLEAAWNTFLLQADEVQLWGRKNWLQWHAAFWDEQQYIPFGALDEHLVLIAEQDPDAGRMALQQISATPQRWAAQSAQIELEARRLEHCTTLEAIAAVSEELAAGELEGPASALLRSFRIRSEDVVAALVQTSTYNQRLVLQSVEDDLNGLLRELTRSDEPYAERFRPIAQQWQRVVANHVQTLDQRTELLQEIPNPYVIGVPLNKRQEIFVGRTDVSAQIEQLLNAEDQPPLLLYGQRRMGKTSLLRHLRWMLPSRIVPLVVDLQGPVASAADHSSFLYNVAKGLTNSAQQQGYLLPRLTRDELRQDPFTLFDDWLDEVENVLEVRERRAVLLAFDEFEALDFALTQGSLVDQPVLGTLRHLIQHRTHFKLLLAGAHTIDEFGRWSSYLINARMVHLGYLQESETQQLIERPIKDFPLAYEPAACQRVIQLTRGHPYLVQVLCSEIVNEKNEQPPRLRQRVTLQDVDGTIKAALETGHQFFEDIQRHQIDPQGLAILRRLAGMGEGAIAGNSALWDRACDAKGFDQSLRLLIRRELVERVNGGYRFQVELIRRWFAQQEVAG